MKGEIVFGAGIPFSLGSQKNPKRPGNQRSTHSRNTMSYRYIHADRRDSLIRRNLDNRSFSWIKNAFQQGGNLNLH